MAHHKTLTVLRTAVRDRLDESTASFWSNAQIDRYLNRAKDRVWNRVKSLNEDYFDVTRYSTDGTVTILGESYATSSFAIIAGTSTTGRDYTLPPDFSEMRLVEVTTANYEDVRFVYRDMAHPEMRSLMQVTDGQTPSYFVFDIIGERTMRIAPLSNAALDLRITYVQAFPDMTTDADEMTMPHPLYLAVEAVAAGMALKQDRNPDAGDAFADANTIIAEMFGASHRQTQDPESAVAYLADYTGWS